MILPSDFAWVSEKKILGLSVLDRIAKGAKKAGFVPRDGCQEACLILFPNFLFSTDCWKILAAEQIHEGEAVMSPQNPNFILLKSESSKISERVKKSVNAEDLQSFVRSSLKLREINLTPKDFIPVQDQDDIPKIKSWLLKGLVKDTEGFMSKHFERRISLSVTRLLANTFVTPNQMTVLSLVPGIVGAFLFLSPVRAHHVLGAFLFWLHSVLDGCDGEIARLKYKESRFGGLLDFFGDNVVHSAVFFCIALGWKNNSGAPWAPLAGALAISGTILSASFVYWTTMRKKEGEGPLFTSVSEDSSTTRFIDFLARRDFIYLVLLLAIFGKIQWFLLMGAVGAPIYFLVLIGLHLRSGKFS